MITYLQKFLKDTPLENMYKQIIDFYVDSIFIPEYYLIKNYLDLVKSYLNLLRIYTGST